MKSQSHEVAKLTVLDQKIEALAASVIDSVFRVHQYFGPGMLESVYEAALCKVLEKKGVNFTRQERIPVFFEGELLQDAFRADVVVENDILLEIKACETLMPVHKAQTLSYLRLSSKPLGFLLNFNVPVIKNGIVRIINDRFAS